MTTDESTGCWLKLRNGEHDQAATLVTDDFRVHAALMGGALVGPEALVGTIAAVGEGVDRAVGVAPVDSRGGDLPARVRAIAPRGVAAVFDHVGGPGLVDSWKLVARGGTLVS